MSRGKKSALVFLAIVLAAVGSAFILFAVHDFRIANKGLQAPGAVTALHPEHHAVDYKFDYNGTTFHGTGRLAYGDAVGSNVTVSFEAVHPEYSLISDPATEGLDILVPGCLALAGALVVIGVLIFGRAAREKS